MVVWDRTEEMGLFVSLLNFSAYVMKTSGQFLPVIKLCRDFHPILSLKGLHRMHAAYRYT
jgi:hypothetical protein